MSVASGTTSCYASGAECSADESGRPALLRKKKKKAKAAKGEKPQPGRARAAAARTLEDPPAADAAADAADAGAEGPAGQREEDKAPAVV